MRILFYSFILCLLTFASCHGGQNKKAAIEHLCYFFKGMSHYNMVSRDFSEHIGPILIKISQNGYSAEELPSAWDSIIAINNKFIVRLDSVINEVSSITSIKNETGLQKNTLIFLKRHRDLNSNDFNSSLRLSQKNNSKALAENHDQFASIIMKTRDLGQNINDLQLKFEEEFKLTDAEIQEAMDCSTK